jgi:hypothetical protein
MPVTTSSIDETLLITIDRPPVNALDLDMITSRPLPRRRAMLPKTASC